MRHNAFMEQKRSPSCSSVLALCGLTALTSGCVYLPETKTVYNAECDVFERRVTLEGYQVASVMGCRDEGCVAALVVAGVVSATTAIVSGSVVIVGKVAYWLEKEGHCLAKESKPAVNNAIFPAGN